MFSRWHCLLPFFPEEQLTRVNPDIAVQLAFSLNEWLSYKLDRDVSRYLFGFGLLD